METLDLASPPLHAGV